MPLDWVLKPKTALISPQQRELVEEKVRSWLGITVDRISGLDSTVWWPITRQIYADVARNGKPDRVDTFNGNYGLNRGLAAASLLLACIAGVQGHWQVAAALMLLTIIYSYRAYRFGMSYARELFIQFLAIEGVGAKVQEK